MSLASVYGTTSAGGNLSVVQNPPTLVSVHQDMGDELKTLANSVEGLSQRLAPLLRKGNDSQGEPRPVDEVPAIDMWRDHVHTIRGIRRWIEDLTARVAL